MTKQRTLTKTKLAVAAGAAALAALAPHAHAQSSDALIDKLVSKGILTTDEAKDLREETDKDFKTAYQTRTGMPDWVTSLKINGDFRTRMDQINATDNSNYRDRLRFRYRLRFGVTASLLDNMEVGFRLASGDAASGFNTGNPVSSTSTEQDNGSKKSIYIDTAYAKWKAIDSGDWLLTATVGKMENPFQFTPMVFDGDYTPEGAAANVTYTLNEQHSLSFNNGAFVLDEEGSYGGANTTQDPYMLGSQLLWNAKWTPKFSTTAGAGILMIGNPEQLTSTLPGSGQPTGNVPYVNQGNTRADTFINGKNYGVLASDFTPLVFDASATYMLDSFPMYPGKCPVKLQGEFINNPGADNHNQGFWVGTVLGKSGAKHTWDLSYRYEYLEADAWYDQVVDDDPVVFYQNQNTAAGVQSGAFAGTNIKGHLLRFNYSITDYLTLTLSGYLTSLVEEKLPGSNVRESNSTCSRLIGEMTWKF